MNWHPGTLDWTGNDAIAPFTLTSDDGDASALVEPSGFVLDGANTAFDEESDADGLDQGIRGVVK